MQKIINNQDTSTKQYPITKLCLKLGYCILGFSYFVKQYKRCSPNSTKK